MRNSTTPTSIALRCLSIQHVFFDILPAAAGRVCLNSGPSLLWAQCIALLLVLPAGCSSDTAAPGRTEVAAAPEDSPHAIFRERTDLPQLQNFHVSNPDSFEMPGIMGSGCSLADLNNDDRLDLILVPGEAAAGSKSQGAAQCRILLQQDHGAFTDISGQASVRVHGFGMGCFAGDLDNDGDLDLVTTSSTGVLVFRNDLSGGQVRFTDITAASGVESSRWSTAAAFVDYDQDGWLDLMIVHYVDYFPGSICSDASGRRDYCGPQSFTGTSDLLFRNRGATGEVGSFENVTVAAGLTKAVGKGLGLICADVNDDRLPDFYVANDMEPNFLWIQKTPGTFVEEAALRGCAVDIQGRPQASMGTALADLDQDGQLDLFLTHLRGETNTWYRPLGNGVFLDDTARSGLGEASRNFTGFGVTAQDFDLDGFQDMAVANGRVMRAPLLQPEAVASHWEEYAERNQVFRGRGQGRFEIVSGDAFSQPVEVSRGLAAGDIDNDGDVDLLVSTVAAPARLYENVAERLGHWLNVRVICPEWKRDAIGARIVVVTDQTSFVAEVLPCAGYLASHDPRVHFGLGKAAVIRHVDVYWPDEVSGFERFVGGPVDQFLTLRRGSGQRMTESPETGAVP
jgi:hypothetical protein